MTTPHPHHPIPAYAARELADVYAAATPAQRRRGRSWYPTMRRTVGELAAGTGYAPVQAAAVLAITSPDAQLSTNVDWTRRALESNGAARVGKYPTRMVPAVQAVLSSPARDALDLVSGPKVHPFARAIMGDRDALVLDRWAYAAANPFRSHSADPKPDGSKGASYIGDRTRRELELAYRIAAAAAGETVRSYQAIVWTVVRESTPDELGRVRRLADITN